MAFSSLPFLALIVLVGYVNCQFGINRNEQDEPIADGCTGKVMDIFFILDSSSSIYINDYRTELQFTRDVVARFDVRPDATRVGALTFSDDYERPVMSLTRFASRQEAINGINIQNLRYRTGVTNTDLAIRYVNEQQGFREDITKVIVVVTDGGSRSPGATEAEAERARANGFYMFVVGVGQYLDEREWRAIANDPDDQFLYNITNYRFLDSVKFSLPPRACALPPIILRETCDVRQPSEVYFVASRSTSEGALQLIENFKDSTRDNADDLSLNYIIDACNYATNVLVRDDMDLCDGRFSRRLPETPDAVSSLISRARDAARESQENSPRTVSQTLVLFVDDTTMSTSASVWSQESSLAQQFDRMRVVVVDMGLRNYRVYLNRLTSNREDIIPFLGGVNQRDTRNTMVERVCDAVNYVPTIFNATPV